MRAKPIKQNNRKLAKAWLFHSEPPFFVRLHLSFTHLLVWDSCFLFSLLVSLSCVFLFVLFQIVLAHTSDFLLFLYKRPHFWNVSSSEGLLSLFQLHYTSFSHFPLHKWRISLFHIRFQKIFILFRYINPLFQFSKTICIVLIFLLHISSFNIVTLRSTIFVVFPFLLFTSTCV